jgi:hypothetical protein
LKLRAVLENFYHKFPVTIANKVQFGQVMKSGNEITKVIFLEYVERQIVINQVKFSTKQK